MIPNASAPSLLKMNLTPTKPRARTRPWPTTLYATFLKSRLIVLTAGAAATLTQLWRWEVRVPGQQEPRDEHPHGVSRTRDEHPEVAQPARRLAIDLVRERPGLSARGALHGSRVGAGEAAQVAEHVVRLGGIDARVFGNRELGTLAFVQAHGGLLLVDHHGRRPDPAVVIDVSAGVGSDQ